MTSDLFSRILNLLEAGLINRWIEEWFIKERQTHVDPECSAMGPIVTAKSVNVSIGPRQFNNLVDENFFPKFFHLQEQITCIKKRAKNVLSF